MISIVSGYMRTGTSMMMQALIAGGMAGVWSPDRDRLADAKADEHYHPNPAGLFEIPLTEYHEKGFPLAYDGKLIKVMLWGVRKLAPAKYRVVLMHRDPEEIRQSYEAFFGRPVRARAWPRDYSRQMEQVAKILTARADVRSVARVSYRDVVEKPREIFELIAESGWPIDIDRAAAVVDPAQYRFRLEHLTPGI